jgi:hypothetical protein
VATTAAPAPNSRTADVPVGHDVTDEDMGRAFALGVVIGIPIMWAVSFGIMMFADAGLGASAGASVFVAAFIGPFVGALILLMRRIFQLEHS